VRSRQIREVALREIVTRGRSNGYRVVTGLMLVLAVVAPIVMAYLPDPTDDLRDVTVGVEAGAPPAFVEQLELLSEGVVDLMVFDLSDEDAAGIEARLRDGRIDVALRPPRRLIWDDTEDSTVANLITAALQQAEAIDRADELGLDVGDLARVFAPIELDDEFVDESSNTEGVRSGVALFGLFIAFLLPQVFGQFTMMSVVEEKSTRIVEVLLSQIRPVTLLAGKILGLSALAIVQLTVIVVGLIASLMTTKIAEVPASVWQFVPLMALSILGGLAIYMTLFALLGSLISRQEDQAQVMLPVFAPLMIGYFVGQTAVFGNAETVLAKVLTWFPLTAPMLLPVRVARSAIGPIEVAVSLGLLALGSYLLFRLAGRLYEFTLLRTGSRVGWGEMFRLSLGRVDD